MRVKIGCDIVDIKRVEKLYHKLGDNFLDKFLSPFEKQFLRKNSKNEYMVETIAGFYALKEAAAKALDCGICKECGFYDIIIVRDVLGSLCVFYSFKVVDFFNLGVDLMSENEIKTRFSDVDFSLDGAVDFNTCKYIDASVSHDNGMAMAVVSFIKG